MKTKDILLIGAGLGVIAIGYYTYKQLSKSTQQHPTQQSSDIEQVKQQIQQIQQALQQSQQTLQQTQQHPTSQTLQQTQQQSTQQQSQPTPVQQVAQVSQVAQQVQQQIVQQQQGYFPYYQPSNYSQYTTIDALQRAGKLMELVNQRIQAINEFTNYASSHKGDKTNIYGMFNELQNKIQIDNSIVGDDKTRLISQLSYIVRSNT